MFDFIGYVVAELKGKRLSKTDAIELVRQFYSRGTTSSAPASIHPLLHRNTSDLTEQRYTTTLTGKEFFLTDHQVEVAGQASQMVLPGVAYLEMVRAAVEDALPDRPADMILQLKDTVWARPIVVAGDTSVSIGLSITDDAQIDFEISSGGDAEKISHCQGRAVWGHRSSPTRINVAQLSSEMTRDSLASAELYETFAGMGMIYGPAFRAITELHRGEGRSLAELRLPEEVDGTFADYVLHPSLMDSALQACIGLSEGELTNSEPRMPFSLDSLRILGPLSREMFAWVRYSQGSSAEDEFAKLDITVCDGEGNSCVEMIGFSHRALQSQEGLLAESSMEAQDELLTFVPVWNSFESERLTRAASESGTVLIDGEQVDLAWLQKTRPNASQISLPLNATVDALAEKLEGAEFDHLLWIASDVVKWNGEREASDASIIEQQESGVLAVFRIIKALLRLGYSDKELRWTFITGKTQRVVSDDVAEPANAGVFGLIGSLAKEYPHWKLRLLDVDSLEAMTADECLSIAEDSGGNGIACRDRKWFRQEFVAQSSLPLSGELRYRSHGVYVVIGGAGGLGQAWTRFMIESYQAHVVWIGRRKCDASIEERISELAQCGPAPLYISADAAKLSELERAYSEILKKYPTVHGVVHSAVVPHDQTIAGMEEAQFRAGLSAKVEVSVNLDRVFGGQELDFMLFFSSVVSFVKSPAQSNYAAGCAFKDSFAQRLQKQRDYPVKIIHWGYWGSVGGAADDYHRSAMEKVGVGSIEADEGMALLERFVGSELNQMAAIKMIGGQEVPYIHVVRGTEVASVEGSQWTNEEISSEHERTPEHNNAETISDEALREKAIAYFQQMLASTLKMRPDQVEPRRSLGEYGLDSILVGQLTYQMRKAFPNISSTLLFEVKNIVGLAEYFVEERKLELANVLSPAASFAQQNTRNNKEIAELAVQKPAEPLSATIEKHDDLNNHLLREKGVLYFQQLIASTLKMRPEQIEPRRALGEYGLDSILVGQLMYQIRKVFPNISGTLLFEVKNVVGLVDYFVEERKQELAKVLGLGAGTSQKAEQSQTKLKPATAQSSRKRRPLPSTSAATSGRENTLNGVGKSHNKQTELSARRSSVPSRSIVDVAVVGLSGRYPQSENLKVFWKNLVNGVNCITEVPRDRWKWEDYFDEEKGKSGRIYTKWGGFLDGIAQFDPLFFKISPKEARSMDPQERLFLECCYHAVEDAGYTPEALGNLERVGVFVGVMNSRYALQPAHFSVANRVSYLFNFQGPSIAVDTACSSSLTAIHLALESIYSGESACAIAGGVNLIIDPAHYFQLTEMTMLTKGNKVKAFGAEADGVVDAEGVGAVLLKPLSDAERDGDHIYAVIKSSAINAGGRTNGYTVPNPKAQSKLIAQALERANVSAEQLSYVEAHGTGTALGDPIEISGLTRAFKQTSDKKQFCPIGSLKSNIGHCESAAGIAGLTKVLLQLKYGQLVPSLHSEVANPEIDFSETPFRVQKSLEPWQRPVLEVNGATQEILRVAGVSSFGAGGANAHLVVQEYSGDRETTGVNVAQEIVIPLSAKSSEQLKQKAQDLLEFLLEETEAGTKVDLASLGYTLQVGREAMEERLGMVVSSVGQLVEELQGYIAGKGSQDLHQGQVKRGQEALSLFSSDDDLKQTIEKWIASKKYSKLLELWVKGLEVDWNKLYSERRPQRMSLPVYPFARERYWIEKTAGVPMGGGASAAAVLHPLLHRNTSDLSEQRFSSTFTGDEFFLSDHQLKTGSSGSRKVLPGVAYLEMARVAVEQAWPEEREGAVLELRNVVWAQPLEVSGNKEIDIALWDNGKEVEYQIYSRGENAANGEEETVHCQGVAAWIERAKPAKLDLEKIKEKSKRGKWEAEQVYAAWERMGAVYGSGFRSIKSLQAGTGQVLAELKLPKSTGKSQDYVLHPSLVDGALQAAIGLLDIEAEAAEARVPFALDKIRITSRCAEQMYAWVRYASGSRSDDKIVRLDIDLCDEQGNICAQLHGLSSRELKAQSFENAGEVRAGECLMAAPVWRAVEVDGDQNRAKYTEHNILLCELEEIDLEKIVTALPDSQCLSLPVWEEKHIAERYSEYALACFKRIQVVLQSKPDGKVLLQIAVRATVENAVVAGLWGLLKTATLENPQLVGQLVLASPEVTSAELARQLQAEARQASDRLVRYEQGRREVLQWEEVSIPSEKAPKVFQDSRVYLITGGLGGLGVVFAKEILSQTRDAKVVLTGRGEANPEKLSQVEATIAPGQTGRVFYWQLDLTDVDQIGQLITDVTAEHGEIKGILHSAGMIADNFILKKDRNEFVEVLAPKVVGTYNLDQATKDLELDFFVLFSSIAGAMGNVGQADYAAANGFMDQFAVYRNQQVATKQRRGKTRSINWGAWQAGGMTVDAEKWQMMQEATGMQAMQTSTGVEAFYRSLALPGDRVLVAEGDLSRMRVALTAQRAEESSKSVAAEEIEKEPSKAVEVDSNLEEKIQNYLRKQLSELLQLAPHKIDVHAALENYGIDSILAMKLTNQLEKNFGSLSKTLFFEYQTIAGLAGYFLKAHPAIVAQLLGSNDQPAVVKVRDESAGEKKRSLKKSRNRARLARVREGNHEEIAIVGLAGRYPQAENLREFWKNLKEGRDCVTEIPHDRWDHSLYFDPDKNKLGKSYSKWGGFLADVDKFDPLFFNISPKEAALTDPQERLFLQTAWETIEDAGYTKESMSGGRVGVFVGVMWGQYELYAAEAMMSGDAALPNSSYASIANRVSYFFDFHGPSIALDTMCSSSLTAIHLACAELRTGQIEAAIAGGVNLSVHPSKYLSMSQGKFAASDGKCRSFGKGGDGYVPGEGVGAVLLKTLGNALRDGDQIYAVIKSSALNHGGKTNGYTVPNPNAQGDLIVEAYKRANVEAKTLGYLETHGTGTALGDPIEITGLMKAFESSNYEKQSCPIGSVKSNIGHLESAAGIAAVTKALLQIKHKCLVPSLHADPLNPNINFQETPFFVQTKLAEWKHTAAHPRRVGVSSFGAGGSNAHLVLEEYAGTREQQSDAASNRDEVFVLSAKDQHALVRYAERMVGFLNEECAVSLADLAVTSQTGRSAMDARLAIICSSVEELKSKLSKWTTDRKGGATSVFQLESEQIFHGSVRDAQFAAVDLVRGKAGKTFLAELMAGNDLEKLARFWVLGVDVDWRPLGRDSAARRVSIPTYPFAKERCWVESKAWAPRAVQSRVAPKKAPARRRAIARTMLEEKKRTYYRREWSLRPLAEAQESLEAIGTILVLDASDELFAALKEESRNRFSEGSFVLVKPGRSFEQVSPSVYTVDPEREEQFAELVADLRNKSLLPSVVIHGAANACDLRVKHEVEQRLNHGLYSLLHLSKPLMKEKSPGTTKFMSVYSASERSEVLEESEAPLDAAVGGFLKTLALENPRYRVKVLQIQASAERHAGTSLTLEAGLVWQEICEKSWTAQEVRYRKRTEDGSRIDERYVNELRPLVVDESRMAALPLKKNGVYVITGGLGGLGLIFAEYLARKFQSKLVLVGRSAPSTKVEETLNLLRSYGAEVEVIQADVANLEDAERLVREAKGRFTKVDGVIHAAGVNRDSLIARKTRGEVRAVLAAKVDGTINLDLATKDEDLDFFVLFSSIAGVLGNVGQSDYAFANNFQDVFAHDRESMKNAGRRSGRTLSINWPLWAEGGMTVSPAQIEMAEKHTGICPLPTQDGIQYWEDLLRSGVVQGVALYGLASRISAAVAQRAAIDKSGNAKTDDVDVTVLLAKTEEYLKSLVGAEIKLSPERIGSRDRLESFGIDSVMINQLNMNLERDLGPLPKTMLYEHETVQELAQFLESEARPALIALFGLSGFTEQSASVSSELLEEETLFEEEAQIAVGQREEEAHQSIAIIGIHGSYPHSANLAEYWENIKQGRDLIDLVPARRWKYEDFYDPNPAGAADGKIYCKWGGFLDDYDKFDARFFKISAEEAKVMDPQERLFLESVWSAIEDAGYTRESLKKLSPKGKSADVGVFVGVTTNSYHLLATEERSHGNVVFPSALPWSIANRVSYFFDFSGPSMPIDTACSSSLVAVHMACESLKRNECQVAIAGGVNLYLHSSKYQSLCHRRMLSLDGKCHSYGAGDDGFVPGEGIGTLVLKPLSRAIEQNDHIYAVIPASAFEHSGRSNGYSAPNPNAQARLISETLERADIHPESISYVEGHGTGTQLGDGIEVAALTQAFRKHSTKTRFCPIGSVKANVGHSESAAGMASMAKVILQMKHRQLAPSIYSDEPNANIEFAGSPFYLQHGLTDWVVDGIEPRRALVNSFGAGGVNACVVLEEYQESRMISSDAAKGPFVFVLSAKNEERLREYVDRMLVHLRDEKEIDLEALGYTLQVGREAMEERLATVVADAEELSGRLSRWIAGEDSTEVYRGKVLPRGRAKRGLELVKGEQRLDDVAKRWVEGEEIRWESLYANVPQRVSLPAYPFARERHWISNSTSNEKPTLLKTQLHPLISFNSSTLKETSFTSLLSDRGFYAVDHKVNGEGIFPGAGFLEIACMAGNIAAEHRVRKITDIVWVQPLRFRRGEQSVRTVLKSACSEVEYVISSLDDENEEILHSEGRLIFRNDWSRAADVADRISIEKLKVQCTRLEDVAEYYEKFRKFGVQYGPSFQPIHELYLNDSFALAKLKIADHLKGEFGQFILHPSLVDGALQTAASLVGGTTSANPHLPFALDEIDILHPVRQTCYAYAEYADSREKTLTGVRKFNIRLLNESGDLLLTFKNLFVRALPSAQSGRRAGTLTQLSAATGAD